MGVQCVYAKVGKNPKIKAYTNNLCQNPSHSNEIWNQFKKECTVKLSILISCIKSNSNRKVENIL